MDDYLFILVFLAIAVVQGIGQKRRKDAKKRNQPMGAPTGPSTGLPQRASQRASQQSSQRPSQRHSTQPRPEPEDLPVPSGAAEAGGSEGLIPSDVWQEILGLARGTTQTPESRPAPTDAGRGHQEQPSTIEATHGVEDFTPESPSPEPPVRDRQPRPSSREFIRQPSPAALKRKEAAASSAGATRTPALGERGREGQGARAQLFGSGSVEELRKAIILQEVLGPPLALRDEAG